MNKQDWLKLGCFLGALIVVLYPPSAQAGDPSEIMVRTTEDLVAAMNPANAGRTIQIEAGTYCPNVPMTLPERSRILGAGQMEYKAGLPVGFREDTAVNIIPADGGIRCPGEYGEFTGNFVFKLTDGTLLRGIKISIDLSTATYPKFVGNTVLVLARGDQVLHTRVAECDITARRGPPNIPPGMSAGRAVTLQTGDFPPNADLPGDPKITATISQSIIRGNNTVANSPAMFLSQNESRGEIFLTLHGNVIKEGTLDVVGGVSRIFSGIKYYVEGVTTEVLSIGNLYQGNGTIAARGWNLTGGAGSPTPGSPGSDHNKVTMTSLNDRIENVGRAVHLSGAARRDPNIGESNNNTVDLRMMGTELSVLEPPVSGGFTADFEFCPNQAPITPNLTVSQVGDGNWIYFAGFHLNGSGERQNIYEQTEETAQLYSTVCGYQDSLGEDSGVEIWGNLKTWLHVNQDIDPPPPEALFAK